MDAHDVIRLAVDLRDAPGDRWRALDPLAAQVRELVGVFYGDLSTAVHDPRIRAVARQVVPAAFAAECDAVAARCGLDGDLLLLGNASYDLLKFRLGCTAVAVDTPQGPLHARNLDWWQQDTLSRLTARIEVAGAPAGPFTIIGWPGFLGALSGHAPGRFALSMNAVSSTDWPVPEVPIAVVLREVLATAPDFAAAVHRLCHVPLACDALILVTGCRAGEMAVVERTPTRHAVRGPVDGLIVATNDYRVLSPTAGRTLDAMLADSADGRHARAASLVRQHRPGDAAGLMEVLADAGVAMCITAQRMAFQPATGLTEVRRVAASASGLFY